MNKVDDRQTNHSIRRSNKFRKFDPLPMFTNVSYRLYKVKEGALKINMYTASHRGLIAGFIYAQDDQLFRWMYVVSSSFKLTFRKAIESFQIFTDRW